VTTDTKPADRAVLLLQRRRELLLDCRAVAEQLGVSPAGQEPPSLAAERIAYGVLVAALVEGPVTTLPARDGRAQAVQRARRPVGRTMAREQERKLR